MSVYLPGDPAWSEVNAEESVLELPGDEIVKEFEKYFKIDGLVYKIVRIFQNETTKNIGGHYYLKENNRKLFLKIICRDEYIQLLKADEISAKLNRQGVYTQALIDGFPKSFMKDYYLFAYNFINNRFAACEKSDMEKISSEVSKLHNVLESIEFKEIMEQTQKREEYFLESFDQKADLIGEQNLKAKEYLFKYKELFFMNFGKKQVIHGDLNFHNIIFDTDTQGPVILDFEDCSHSFFSPLYDIAMLFERYVLLKEIDDHQKYILSTALLKKFNRTYFYGDQFYNMLIFISVRSLLILATIFFNKGKVNNKEIQKFIDHIENIKKNRDLINRIKSGLSE